MKLTINLILITSFTYLLLIPATNECKKSFSGKWKYERFETEYIHVERTLEKQFEYFEDEKYYYEFNIEWLSECKYGLTYMQTTSPVPAAIKFGEKLTVEIVEINNGTMEYKTVFRDLEETARMNRID